jgi:hypothetical protein
MQAYLLRRLRNIDFVMSSNTSKRLSETPRLTCIETSHWIARCWLAVANPDADGLLDRLLINRVIRMIIAGDSIGQPPWAKKAPIQEPKHGRQKPFDSRTHENVYVHQNAAQSRACGTAL